MKEKTKEKSTKEKNFTMNKRGISLIVLVITIVVIIILAVAVIISIYNNNPIENAKEATKKHNKAVEEEKVKMAVLSSFNTNGDFDLPKINSDLGTSIQSLPAVITLDESSYYIAKSGEVKTLTKEDGKIDIATINSVFETNVDEENLPAKVTKDGKTFLITEDGKITSCWSYKRASDGKVRYITNGDMDIEIGSYINYDPTYSDLAKTKSITKTETSNAGSPTDTGSYKATDKTLTQGNGYGNYTYKNDAATGGWRVLGVDDKTGGILIISADIVKNTANDNFYLRGIAGYTYGEKELDKVCSVFGHGYGAESARSVKVEDINKVTGYNPKNTGVYDPEQTGDTISKYYGYNQVYQYNNEVTYKWDTSTANKVVPYVGNVAKTGGTNSSYATYGFNWYDEVDKEWKNSAASNKGQIINKTPLKSSNYLYYPGSLTMSSSGTVGLSQDVSDKQYATIFYNSAKTSRVSYWLGSSYVTTNTYYVDFGLRNVHSLGYVGSSGLYYSDCYANYLYDYAVRPVVSLKSDIQIGEYNSKSDRYDIVK